MISGDDTSTEAQDESGNFSDIDDQEVINKCNVLLLLVYLNTPLLLELQMTVALFSQNYFWFLNTICLIVLGNLTRKRWRHHISIQNLNALALWVTSLLYPTFNPFIVDVGLNYSHLNLTISLTSVSSHIQYLHCGITNGTHILTTPPGRLSIQGSTPAPSPSRTGSDINFWGVRGVLGEIIPRPQERETPHLHPKS